MSAVRGGGTSPRQNDDDHGENDDDARRDDEQQQLSKASRVLFIGAPFTFSALLSYRFGCCECCDRYCRASDSRKSELRGSKVNLLDAVRTICCEKLSKSTAASRSMS